MLPMQPQMNAFKADHMNSDHCDQFSTPTVLTVSLAVAAGTASPAVVQHRARRPPTRQQAPGTGGLPATPPHSTRRFAALTLPGT